MRTATLFNSLLVFALICGSVDAQGLADIEMLPSYSSDQTFAELDCCDSIESCDACNSLACRCGGQMRLFGAIDALVVRSHFSEAVAFAQGNQSQSTFGIAGEPIEFDYEGSVRTFIGIGLPRSSDSVRFTYSYFQGSVDNDGTVNPGQFIVDPFGNVAGSVTVIDPRDARVGTTITGGDSIETSSTVDTHVYDIDFTRRWGNPCRWDVSVDMGVRIADVNQSYDSLITAAGAAVSYGRFGAAFTGAGPRLGIEGTTFLGRQSAIAFRAAAHGSLLLGDYDVVFANQLGGGLFTADQSNSQRRTIPVIETELGGSWRVNDSFHLSAGWLLHFWNDLGVSGGNFGGFFGGADDANSMSFDGLYVRAEIML